MQLPKVNLYIKYFVLFVFVTTSVLVLNHLFWTNFSLVQIHQIATGQIEPVEALTKVRNFGITTLILFFSVGIFLASVLAYLLVKPILKILSGLKHIAEGDYSYRVEVTNDYQTETIARLVNLTSMMIEETIQKSEHNKNVVLSERNKLMVALSNITDAIIMVNLNGAVILMNKAAENLTGLKENQAYGKLASSLIKIFEGNETLNLETFYHQKELEPKNTPIKKRGLIINSVAAQASEEGGNKYFNLIINSIINDSGRRIGNMLVLQDITKEKELEDMKVDFVSMATHELRTPLTLINGYLSVYLKENTDHLSERQKMMLNRINYATQQLMSLVESFLNVAKIEKGVFNVTTEPTDWVSTVRQIVSEFMIVANRKQISLEITEPHTNLPQIEGDKLRLGEVLSNLLSNSLAYTQSGGHVQVWLEAKDNELITHVQDDGPGIPKASLLKLFTKFFRTSKSNDLAHNGSGLGLYISKAIVEAHRGRIWVESEPNQQTIFSFSIPTAAI